MKKLAIFLSVLALPLNPATAADEPPKIIFTNTSHTFGTIPQGKKIEHAFTFTNGGKRPLLIERVRTSCGCTVADIPSRMVEPGKSGSIKAVFDSTNFSGPVTKIVYVHSNDPQLPVASLTLSGIVSEQISVNPRQINLGVIKRGTSREILISVDSREEKITVTGTRTSGPQARAVVRKETAKQGKAAEVLVTITPTAEDRMLSGYIMVMTDHPVKREISIPFFGSVSP